METVRKLQRSFYSLSTGEGDSARPELDGETGTVRNLPLWRVGWVEVPGRSNVLHVHEGHYTNMFEKILAGPQPWYVGHLHLPGGSGAARATGETRFKLKSWQQEMQDDQRFDEKERSDVLGTLMRITDYRRLEDGRLLLLVHVMDRFVVQEVMQDFPYGIANVQILPDIEQLVGEHAGDEFTAKEARAAAVRQSFLYHDYEYDKTTQLPLPRRSEYLSTQGGIPAGELTKVLPFAFYSRDDSSLKSIPPLRKPSSSSASNASDKAPSLEKQLQSELILRNPPPLPGAVRSRCSEDLDSLERLLWLALRDFREQTGAVIPDALLALMPPDVTDSWQFDRPVLLLSEEYPAFRRQQRLSYAAAALLERSPVVGGEGLRSVLLQAPGTKARLTTVLERFELLNDLLLGQFQ
jgi:Lon protease-like protein